MVFQTGFEWADAFFEVDAEFDEFVGDGGGESVWGIFVGGGGGGIWGLRAEFEKDEKGEVVEVGEEEFGF